MFADHKAAAAETGRTEEDFAERTGNTMNAHLFYCHKIAINVKSVVAKKV